MNTIYYNYGQPKREIYLNVKNLSNNNTKSYLLSNTLVYNNSKGVICNAEKAAEKATKTMERYVEKKNNRIIFF
jgi:hypothetical protein